MKYSLYSVTNGYLYHMDLPEGFSDKDILDQLRLGSNWKVIDAPFRDQPKSRYFVSMSENNSDINYVLHRDLWAEVYSQRAVNSKV